MGVRRRRGWGSWGQHGCVAHRRETTDEQAVQVGVGVGDGGVALCGCQVRQSMT